MFRKAFSLHRQNRRPRRRWPASTVVPPSQALPRIETLEVRCTPSCTSGLIDRLLLVACDNSGNTVTMDHNSATSITTANGVNFADSSFDTITINNGSDRDVDNINAIPLRPLTINGAGLNTVNLGNAGNGMKGMLGTVNVKNPPSFTTLNVNDGGGQINSFNGNLSVSNGVGTISFSGSGQPGVVTYNTGDVGSLSVTAGGGDVFNVLSTTAGAPVTIDGGPGVDTVNLGNTTNGVQSLLGPVTVAHSNPNGHANLNVNDGADSAGRTVTMSVNGSLGTIVGLAPTTITYNIFNLPSYGITAGRAADVFNVLSTPSFEETACNSSGGADTINVGNTSNGMQSILGSLLVQNTPSFTTLNLNDAADTVGRTVTLNVAGSFGFVNGLAPEVEIQYALSDVNALNVTAGRAAATINVQSTAAGIPVTLNSGGGNDTVNVGNSTNGVQSIPGPLSVHNGPAFSTLNVDDSADTTARTVTMSVAGTTGTISGVAPTAITYATTDVSGVSLFTGHGADTVNVQSTAADTPVTVDSSGGNDSATWATPPTACKASWGTWTSRTATARVW
jgi:hypothetical protein